MVACEDCKFANWDYRLFADFIRTEFAIRYYSEQFDCYCSLLNKFFLEDEITGHCSKGEYGENNMHKVCQKYYRQRQHYIDLIKEFRESRDLSLDSYKEFELFLDFFKKKEPELYNEMQD